MLFPPPSAFASFSATQDSCTSSTTTNQPGGTTMGETASSGFSHQKNDFLYSFNIDLPSINSFSSFTPPSSAYYADSVLFCGSEQTRYEYDISELELYGRLAIDLKVQNHPLMKQLFAYLVSLAGQPYFSQECAMLGQLLTHLQNQLEYRNVFAEWHLAQYQHQVQRQIEIELADLKEHEDFGVRRENELINQHQGLLTVEKISSTKKKPRLTESKITRKRARRIDELVAEVNMSVDHLKTDSRSSPMKIYCESKDSFGEQKDSLNFSHPQMLCHNNIPVENKSSHLSRGLLFQKVPHSRSQLMMTMSFNSLDQFT